MAPSTISTYTSALSYVHKIRSFSDPTKAFVVQKIMTAQSRLCSKPDIRLPITRSILHKLVLALSHTITSAYHILLFQTMFLVAFYGFFRVGELTIKTPARRHAVLKFQSLCFLKSQSEVQAAKLVISDYKHNTTGRPFPIIIHRDSTVQFCPVEFLLRWCRVRGSNTGPLFCLDDGSAVKSEVFTRQLKGALAFCDLDCSRYKSHSFRIGAASLAAENGMSDAQIRGLGRWKSDAFKLYIRSPTAWAN